MARGKPVRSELKKIFAEPRNWFFGAAWFLSIALSLFLNHQQNQKWNALNHPQIQLTNIFLIPFETLSQETTLNRHWGYHPLVFSILENGIERIQAFTELTFIDRTTKDRVFGSRRMMKLEDARDEQKRLNLSNVELVKHFQMKV